MKFPRPSSWVAVVGTLIIAIGVRYLHQQAQVSVETTRFAQGKKYDGDLLADFLIARMSGVSNNLSHQSAVLQGAIDGRHPNTRVTVQLSQPGRSPLPMADNLGGLTPGLFDGIDEVLTDRALQVPEAGLKFERSGTHYFLLRRTIPVPKPKGIEISGSEAYAEVSMLTNLDSATSETRNNSLFWSSISILVVATGLSTIAAINVVPSTSIGKALRTKKPLKPKWFWPGVAVDVADQLQADREANEQFRASISLQSRVIEFSPVPTFICQLPINGKEAIITYANKAVTNLFGHETPIGQPLNILVPQPYWIYHTWDTVPDEPLKRGVGMAGCPHAGAGESRVMGKQRPVPAITQDGRTLQVLLSVDRIADEPDGSRNFIGTLQNISELMASQEAETAARKKAEALAEEIENVNHIAVHDIKADLTAVGKGSEVIAETIEELISYLGASEDEVLLDAIDTIKFFSGLNVNSAKNAFEVLDQRNKLYDLESKIEIAPCSVSDILAALEAAFSSESGEFRTANDCPENRLISADYSLLLTVLKNIIRNGYIHNDSPLKRVEVRVGPNGQYSRITITDNGVGMPEAYLERWGKTMGKAAQLSGRGGSGTGLYSIRRIVDAHPNASIDVTSAVGQGTTFTLEFPHVP